MEYSDVLGLFSGFSRSFYIYSAALTIVIDGIIIFLLAAQKFPRNGYKFNNAFILSLALCDLGYEAVTTTLLLQSQFCKVVEKCKTLYFIYIFFNLSTVFHIVAEIIGKMMHHVLVHGVCWSVCAWLCALVIACVDVNNDSGRMDATSMASLGKFKAFGQIVFAVIFISGVFVVWLMIWFSMEKGKKPLERFPKQESCPGNTLVTTIDNVLLSSIFLAFLVSWYAWIVIGIDSEILMAIEIMKSFEVIRLGSRLLNPLTLFSTVLKEVH